MQALEDAFRNTLNALMVANSFLNGMLIMWQILYFVQPVYWN